MRIIHNHFSEARDVIYVAFLVPSTLLAYAMTETGADSHRHRERVILNATLASSGPFAGWVSREGHGCLPFRLSLAPYCGGMFAAGVLMQVSPLPRFRHERAVRLTAWTFRLAGWYAGPPLSLMYSFS